MKTKVKFKGQAKGKVTEYVRRVPIQAPKTVRADEELWKRIDALAKQNGCSANELIVAALTKVCDEEAV